MNERSSTRVALLCLLAAASCATTDTEGPAPVPRREVSPFDGLDLTTLKPFSARERLLPLFRGRVPLQMEGQIQGCEFEPWHCWEVKEAEGTALTILIAGDRHQPVPGSTKVRLGVLDKAGATLGVTDFSMGWRTYLRRARITTVPWVDGPILEMQVVVICGPTRGARGGPRRGSQFYAILQRKPVLIRDEVKEGGLRRNNYHCERCRIGPPVPERSPEEWTRRLVSQDRREVLAALVWLGSKNTRPSGLAEGLRRSESVKTRLEELADSRNKWLAEAARSVLDLEFP